MVPTRRAVTSAMSALVAAGFFALGLPVIAAAGEYTMRVCDTTNQIPASESFFTASGATSTAACQAGSLKVRFSGNAVEPNQGGGIAIAPPANSNARIVRATGRASVGPKTGDPNSSGRLTTDHGGANLVALPLSSWSGGTAPGNSLISFDFMYPEPLRQVRFLVTCDSRCDFSPDSGSTQLEFNDLAVRLKEDVPPTVRFAATGLLGPGPREGQQVLDVTFRDEDSGVAAYSFSTMDRIYPPVPCQAGSVCPKEYNLPITVDTAKLPAGLQTVGVAVADSAGNRADFRTPPFFVWHKNHSRILGTEPLVLTGPSRKRKIDVKFGGTPTEFKGKLLDNFDGPLAGGEVHVLETGTKGGATRSRVAILNTGRDGGYAYSRPAERSAKVEFAVPKHRGADDYDTIREVKVTVRAGVSLGVDAKTLRRGRAVTFSGQLKAPAAELARQDIVMQVRSAYGWQDVRVLRTTRDGRFSWKHTFRSAGQFKFRARVRSSETLSVSPNESSTIALRVR